MYGPEPFIGQPWCILKSCMKILMYDESSKHWENQKNLKAKLGQEMIGFPDKSKAKDILKLNRQEIRLVTGFLTGHYPVKSRLVKMTTNVDIDCRFCLEENETTDHILCECVALERTRLKFFGYIKMHPSTINEFKINSIAKFLKKISEDL